jgi:phenylacetate-coenzyme A ligase PaaK-like adenylate-forming protein
MTAAATATRARQRHARVRAALPAHLDRLTWDRGRIAAYQRDRLRALLRHARRHSAFHADRLAGVDVERFELTDLPGLPTMTKSETMAAFDDIVTDPRLTRRAVEEHLATTGTEARELLDGYVALASGGSSGTRGLFVYGPAAIVDYLLGLTRVGIRRLLDAGGPPPGGVPLAMVAARSAVHASRALSSLFTGDIFAVEPVPASLPLAQIVDRLNTVRPVLLQGYPSVLALLAEEQVAGRLRIAPLGVTGSSEQFPAEARARVAAAFGVGVVDQYACTEGVAGVSEPDEPVVVLASDLCVVEPVDARGEPVPAGTPSAKVLVTNLANPVQPLIRYELEDRFVVQPDSGTGHLRVTVEGRADDTFVYGALSVHPSVLRTVLVQTPQVIEYQVGQRRRGARVAVVASPGLDRRLLTGRLAAALEAAGLARPDVAVDVVDAVDRDPQTGKARRFVALPH